MLKIRYKFKHKESGKIETKIFTIEEVEQSKIPYYYMTNDYEIIERTVMKKYCTYNSASKKKVFHTKFLSEKNKEV